MTRKSPRASNLVVTTRPPATSNQAEDPHNPEKKTKPHANTHRLSNLGYYSDAAIGRLLPLGGPALGRARQELIRARLIAYRKPLYQVLSLDPPAAVLRSGAARSLGQILRQMERRP